MPPASDFRSVEHVHSGGLGARSSGISRPKARAPCCILSVTNPNLFRRKLLVAVPEQQGSVQRQRPGCAVPPLHGAAASRRRDEGVRRLPGRSVGPGQPRAGVHQDAVQELPHGHALDAAGPLPARYGPRVRLVWVLTGRCVGCWISGHGWATLAG